MVDCLDETIQGLNACCTIKVICTCTHTTFAGSVSSWWG